MLLRRLLRQLPSSSSSRTSPLPLLPLTAVPASMAQPGSHRRCLHEDSRGASGGGGGGGGDSSFDTSFGYERVPAGEKQGRVNAVFNRVSDSYDLMNDLMSFGLHRCWKRRFIASANPRPGWRAVDVAGGTGDVAIGLVQWSRDLAAAATGASHRPVAATRRSAAGPPPPPPAESSGATAAVDDFRRQAEQLLLKQTGGEPPSQQQQQRASTTAASSCHVTVVDPSSAMMEVGRRKAADAMMADSADCVAWREGRAESLPLDSGTCHLYTIAFGMRNCSDLPQALAEAHRVLLPYGRFACLEFCTVENPLMSLLYDEYSFRVIPPLGHLVAGDWDSYQYLVQSIRKFPHQEAFADMMRQAGFAAVTYEVLVPGVCCIHSGYKLP